MTPAQEAKIATIPRHLRRTYRMAVESTGRRPAIRVHCLECVGWLAPEVRACSSPGCALYPYRMGGHPGDMDPYGDGRGDSGEPADATESTDADPDG